MNQTNESNTTSKLNRREFLNSGMATGVAAAALPSFSQPAGVATSAAPAALPPPKPFELEEITVAKLQHEMQSGRLTARFGVQPAAARRLVAPTPPRGVGTALLSHGVHLTRISDVVFRFNSGAGRAGL